MSTYVPDSRLARANASFSAISLYRMALLFALLSACFGLVSSVQAQKLTTLHTFTGNDDGFFPMSSLVQGKDGSFYGTTWSGGTGTVYRITASGTFTTLHTFTGGADGGTPSSLVQGTDGNFYGTTYNGGYQHNNGTAFRITPGGTLTTLHTFSGGTDGLDPNGGLVQGTDGNFYGTTNIGGINNNGVVFRMTPGGTVTTLYSFAGGTDGNYPQAGLVQGSDGNFYGTTSDYGNNGNGSGTVFRLTPGGTLTTLYTFSGGADGSDPSSLVQGRDGNFYGTTAGGGDGPRFGGDGTAFRITPSGTLTTLHTFLGGTDGISPEGVLVQGSDGNFYGTTFNGGSNGTTSNGGSSGNGTVFRIAPNGMLTTLHSFTGGADGSGPLAGLVQGTDGNLYGITTYGGTNSDGTVFSLNAPETWTAVSIASGSDEQTRVLWDRSDGAITLWTLGTNNSLNASPPVFGPYPGWTAKAISVDPGNDTHILWNNSDGRMTLWTVTPGGDLVGSFPVFGPYAGWTAVGIASSPNGNTHVLWSNTDGRMTPWTLDTNDQLIGNFPVYGPYSGWTAKSISAGPNGNIHVLWNNSDGRMTPWTLDANNQLTGNFPVFGPFSGWTATSIATGADNMTRVLWGNSDGRMTPWMLDAGNHQFGNFPVYGPYEGWSAISISASPNGSTHILWDNVDGRMTPWTLDTNNQQTGNFPVYGPY